MEYRVRTSPRSEEDLLEAAEYIARSSPANARRWYRGVQSVLQGLARMPHSCPLARESGALNREIRQTVYKSHRILFTIKAELVRIHRVVHAARQPLDADELGLDMDEGEFGR
jgi:plasmid stabilization system protein ParE